MFKLFNLLYFTPFYFPNGNRPKNKYFIPVARFDNDFLFASLPTSKDFVPDPLLKSGCINEIERQISCFVFLKNTPITTSDFCFEKNTFIYFYEMLMLPVKQLEETYFNANIDYEIVGVLKDSIKLSLITCMLASPMVKLKVKRQLEAYKKTNL